MMAQKLVVIGAGMASGRMLEKLPPGAFDITLFNGEPRGNYNRLMLSPVLSGEKTYEEIITHDDAWYQAQGIATRFGEKVLAIDPARKVVVSAMGETPYDKLVIATGSAPFIIPVPGHKLPGVVTYRDLEDTHAMIAASRTARLSWRPTKVITPASQETLSGFALSAVKIAAEIATPKAAPSEEAIL